jgi:hypothetical protein
MGTLARLKLAGLALACACAGGPRPTSPSPQPWSGFFHPPSHKPGGSITNWQQCDCRACDPSSCCGAEHTESTGAAAPECNANDYDFSECGITVQTCTPRCYSHVWRMPKHQSCSADRPLVCCG